MASAIAPSPRPTTPPQAESQLEDLVIPLVTAFTVHGNSKAEEKRYVDLCKADSLLVVCKTKEAVQAFYEREKGLAGLRFVRQDKNPKSVLMEPCMGGDVSLEKMVAIVKWQFGDKVVDDILARKYANPNYLD
jgi:hypothetical protein